MVHPPNMEIEKTFQQYLSDIRKIDLSAAGEMLGLEKEPNGYFIRFFTTQFAIRPDGFFTAANKKPPHDICIVLCKYLLRCPKTAPADKTLVSFRDFKDSGPLAAYFSSDVENLICREFEDRFKALQNACRRIGGAPADVEADYDLIMRFNALPKLPMILLFNDRDEEFPPRATVLYERRAEVYLDAECLAILGNLLYQSIKR